MKRLKICLFLALPEASQDRPISNSALAPLKFKIKQVSDVVRWNVFGSNEINYYAWQDREGTNKGDGAIRQAVRIALTTAFGDTEIAFTEIAWKDFGLAKAEEIARTHDLFVIAGSGYFHLDSGGNLARRVLRDLDLLARMACPKIAFGIGVNYAVSTKRDDGWLAAPINAEAQNTIREVLSHLSAVSVRDGKTRDLLAPLARTPIYLTGDPALFLAKPRTAERRTSGARPQIGLNIGVHEAGLVRRLPSTIPAYVEFLHRMQNQHGAEIHYVMHTREERSVPRLLRARGVRITSHDLDFRQLPEVYAGLDLHVCEMLHSSILSLSMGVPTLNIAYDSKNVAFYELLGVEPWIHPVSELSADKLANLAAEMLSDRAALSQLVLGRIAALRDANQDFLAAVLQGLAASAFA